MVFLTQYHLLLFFIIVIIVIISFYSSDNHFSTLSAEPIIQWLKQPIVD